eukprot:COSAG01_NODE_11546_length_1906_cov_185.612064_1_plen_390_part_00
METYGYLSQLCSTVSLIHPRLRQVRTVTHKLGTEERVHANNAREFRRKLERYMDSANVVSSGQFWPIVKRAQARGRWDVLKSGATFVDAPGVNDDNSSRDKVVKGYLKSASAIWIVSNINRAVNDKTAKDMLDHNFRRQLLMDGSYGTLVFVATQSDLLQRSEVIRSMRLPDDTSLSDAAAQRCQYTKTRVQSDYIDGLEDMARAAGDVPDRTSLQSRFNLPVFCVSAIEYQKLAGVRTADGPAEVWRTAADTQIPALRAHVHRATLSQRAKIVRRQAESLIQYGTSMLAFCEKGADLPQEQRAALTQVFERLFTPLSTSLKALSTQFDDIISDQFDEKVKPRLSSGAADAKKECLDTATQWSQSWSSMRGGGGLHWATYRLRVISMAI